MNLYDLEEFRKNVNKIDRERVRQRTEPEDEKKAEEKREPTIEDVIAELEEGILKVCEDKDDMSDKLIDLEMKREAARILLESLEEEISEVKDAIIDKEILRRKMEKDLSEAKKAARQLMLPNKVTA